MPLQKQAHNHLKRTSNMTSAATKWIPFSCPPLFAIFRCISAVPSIITHAGFMSQLSKENAPRNWHLKALEIVISLDEIHNLFSFFSYEKVMIFICTFCWFFLRIFRSAILCLFCFDCPSKYATINSREKRHYRKFPSKRRHNRVHG